MKNFILKTLQWILKCLAQAVVWRYRPGIIGVTGSVGKTSTKFAIASVLGGERNVRVSPDSHNNELGFPLAILGEWRNDELELVSKLNPPGTKRVQKIFFWLKVIFAGVWQVISFHKKKYPEILVLEYGADRPGDLKYLLMIARPNVSVITAIGDIPVHVEFYAGPDEIAREKARIIERLPAAGFAILNHDDESVMNLKDRTRAHVITFGFAKGADLRIANFGNVVKGDRPIGISFKLEYGGSSVPVRLEGAFGRAQAYAATAASAIGLIFGMNLITISEALRNYKPSAGRMQVLPGAKDSWLIDDAYNASPASMHAALDTLKSLPAKRKVAVLGDMLELGEYAIEAHERVGRLASGFLDILITVGPRAKFIAETARKNGMRKGSVQSFDSFEHVQGPIVDMIRKGDLVLVKASRGMHLERVVEALRVEAPQSAQKQAAIV